MCGGRPISIPTSETDVFNPFGNGQSLHVFGALSHTHNVAEMALSGT